MKVLALELLALALELLALELLAQPRTRAAGSSCTSSGRSSDPGCIRSPKVTARSMPSRQLVDFSTRQTSAN